MEMVAIGLGVLNLFVLIYMVTHKQGAGLDGAMRDEFAQNRKEFVSANKDLRIELTDQLEKLRDKNDQKLEYIRKTVEVRLESLQKDNAEKLEKMRHTVDEKLQSTLEKRLGESFKIVSERLEQVHKGLGEMQNLATGVGDLKKVLTNVKSRGTWGEVQLGAILEQILSPEQYDKNVAIKSGSGERVEFAVKIPTKDNSSEFVLLPIDAKFPIEDYQRLITAQEKGDTDAILVLHKELDGTIKREAKKIRDKYIDPPVTLEFAYLYLPTEGLYAEVMQKVELMHEIQRDYRVAVLGPSTVTAMLNALQMGFRSLAIAKQTGAVWELLTEIKKEFGAFGGMLEKTRDKLISATTELDRASGKSRTIERKLGKVQQLADKTVETAEQVTLPDGVDE